MLLYALFNQILPKAYRNKVSGLSVKSPIFIESFIKPPFNYESNMAEYLSTGNNLKNLVERVL